MNRHRSILAACLLFAAPAAAGAATKAGVSMPDTLEVEGTTLQLNGLGLRSFTLLQIRGYVGALYLVHRTRDAGQAMSEPGPKALVIHYIRGADLEQVHRLYLDSSKNYCAHHSCTGADRTAFETILGASRAVRPGDRSAFLMGDRGIDVLFDGQKVAHVADAAFARVILESDLGDHPPSEALKNGLLGRDAD